MKSRQELDELYSLIYNELRRLARTMKRTDSSATITPTVLVHEAWLKLSVTPPATTTSFSKFKSIAANAMRQVLVDTARRRNANKRGGGATILGFDEQWIPTASPAQELLALNDALLELERLNPRLAAGVEARFFGGFTAIEIAAMLDISEDTVHADWQAAKAWLGYQLRPAK
jgi:RNA polymerase sigma factor (TIGR02999 family)